MPGEEVKDWGLYHKLREQGYRKEAAAKIANAAAADRRRKRKRRRSTKQRLRRAAHAAKMNR